VLRWSLAAVLLVAGVLFALPTRESGMTWTPYSDAALASARASSKPVIIDFYAAWCIPCKELDAKTFSDDQVIRNSERFVRLKADLTSSDKPEVVAIRSRYQITGIPSILFLGASGKEVSSARLTGFEGPASFAKRLDSVH
jgi:thiol:disulfide interchange protein DsbD